MSVLLLELNEVNFEQVRAYVAQGQLPVLGRLIRDHGITETESERDHHELEPWIQWVTAHTGMPLSEHRVFRLGDIVNRDMLQVWEALEAQGLNVGAICPMNAKNRCRNAAFFVPDPWTPTIITGSLLLKKLYRAVSQAVNDNAQARITPSTGAWLAAGLSVYARPINYARYLALAAAARRQPWSKAMLLDQLLADMFIGLVKQKRPDFASLFLNAGAHIQHHYLFNSAVYTGPQLNPEWYVARTADPVLEVYNLYDRIVGQTLRAFPHVRLLLVTALHQEPIAQPTFYWRLRDHVSFLRKLGVTFARAEPRMSRDFLVVCTDKEEARRAELRLLEVRAMDGTPLFEIDNRGADLFITFTWPHDVPDSFTYLVGGTLMFGLREEVAFVAIKNGDHDGVGYLLDTGIAATKSQKKMNLSEVPHRIAEACGATWKHSFLPS